MAVTNRTYTAINSDWLNSSNWSPAAIPGGGTNSTTAGDSINFSGGSSHTCLFDDNYPSSTPLGSMTIDDTGGFTNTLSMQTQADTLTLSGLVQVGVNGSGGVIETAGITNIVNNNSLYLGNTSTGVGTYTLGNGFTVPSLTVSNNEIVGYSGTGTFTQFSGSDTVGGQLFVSFSAGNGTYNLSGGQLNVNGADSHRASEFIGFTGTGLFNQSGGTHTVGGFSGPGDLDIGGASNGSNATGTYLLSSSTSSATLNVTGSEYLGQGTGAAVTSGTFNQSGGNHTVGYTLFVGGGFASNQAVNSSGTFILSNGSLLVNPADNLVNDSNQPVVNVGEFIGSLGGTARFIQSGGSNSVGALNGGIGGEDLDVGFPRW